MTNLEEKTRFRRSGRFFGINVLTGVLLLVFGVGPLEPLKFVASECWDSPSRTETPAEEREEEQVEIVWTLEASLFHHRRKQLFSTTPQPSPGTVPCACTPHPLFSGPWASFAKRKGVSSPMRC